MFYVIHITTSWSRNYFYPHVIGRETEAQWNKVTCYTQTQTHTSHPYFSVSFTRLHIQLWWMAFCNVSPISSHLLYLIPHFPTSLSLHHFLPSIENICTLSSFIQKYLLSTYYIFCCAGWLLTHSWLAASSVDFVLILSKCFGEVCGMDEKIDTCMHGEWMNSWIVEWLNGGFGRMDEWWMIMHGYLHGWITRLKKNRKMCGKRNRWMDRQMDDGWMSSWNSSF